MAGNVFWGRGSARRRLFSMNAAIAAAINRGFGSFTVVRWRLVKDMPQKI
jgi:hypothetical protein